MQKGTILFLINASILTIALSLGLYGNFVPIFAEKLGASYLDLGIIGTVFSLPYIILPALVGLLSDRVDRRPLYLGGVIGCAITPFLFIYASNVIDIILIRAFNGVAYAFMWPCIEALVADLTNAEERTKAMGKYSFSWAAGFLLGPFIGALMMTVTNDNYPFLYLNGFFIALLATSVAFYGLHGYRRIDHQESFGEDSRPFRPSALLSVLLPVLGYSLSLGLQTSIFPAYASNLGLSVSTIGILFAIFGVVRVSTFLFAHRIAKIGNRRSFALALMTQIFALLLIAFMRNFLALLLFNILFGFAMGILSPLTLTLASKAAPNGKVGLAIGLTEATFGLGMTLGPFIGGIAAQLVSPEMPYIVIAVITFAILALTLSANSTGGTNQSRIR
ncbi:MAG TPA: MFS transporter [Candidatus Bathyarchaeia archaeon]|nr:MFS transporter [Candidatus Bathyarchaeia archaeon]